MQKRLHGLVKISSPNNEPVLSLVEFVAILDENKGGKGANTESARQERARKMVSGVQHHFTPDESDLVPNLHQCTSKGFDKFLGHLWKTTRRGFDKFRPECELFLAALQQARVVSPTELFLDGNIDAVFTQLGWSLPSDPEEREWLRSAPEATRQVQDPSTVSSELWSQELMDRYFARLGREKTFKAEPELHDVRFKEFLNPDPKVKLGAVYVCRWFHREERKKVPVCTEHLGILLSQNPDYRAKMEAADRAPPPSSLTDSQPWAWCSPRVLGASVPAPSQFINYVELLKVLNVRDTPEMRSITNEEAERFFAAVKSRGTSFPPTYPLLSPSSSTPVPAADKGSRALPTATQAENHEGGVRSREERHDRPPESEGCTARDKVWASPRIIMQALRGIRSDEALLKDISPSKPLRSPGQGSENGKDTISEEMEKNAIILF